MPLPIVCGKVTLVATSPVLVPEEAESNATAESPNVVCAVVRAPVAVRVNATPASCCSGEKPVLTKPPEASAVAVRVRSGCVAGSSRSPRLTVSPGCQPRPLIVTGSSGANSARSTMT